MDELMLRHLEGCGSINWYNTIQWQYSPLVGDVAVRPADGTGNDWSDAGNLSGTLEVRLKWDVVEIMSMSVAGSG